MPVPAFTTTEYDQVRSAIDLRLTADHLPDTTIGQFIFEGQAREMVNGNVEDAVITANLERATGAAILYAAALVIPSLVHSIKEDIPGGLMEFQERDLLKIAEQRRAEAGALLAGLQALQTNDPSPTKIPTVFTVGSAPCR